MTISVQSDAFKGALWMLMASFRYVASATLTRYLDGSYDTFQLAFLRCTVGVCVLTPIVLREKVSLKSWLAAMVGFGGVLLIVRPGYIPITIGIIAALGTALGYALVNTLIKVASRHDSPTVMTFYVNVLIMPVSAIPAYIVWKLPIWEDVQPCLASLCFRRWRSYAWQIPYLWPMRALFSQ